MLRTLLVTIGLIIAVPAFSDENPVPCHTNDDCATTEFCSHEAGGTCDGDGQCVPRGINVMCVTTCDAVCGCDGQTYINGCYAHKHGASVASRGPCP